VHIVQDGCEQITENLQLPDKRFGSWGIKKAGWVIEYAIFLNGLAQQWKPQKTKFGTKVAYGMRMMPKLRIHA